MADEVNKIKQTTQSAEISLKELILKSKDWGQYLWNKKWIIIVAGAVGGILGFSYSYIKKPIYTATTTFVLESGEKSGGLGAYAGLASMVGIDIGGGGGGGIFQGDNILDLYQSRRMIEKTLLTPLDTNAKLLIDRYIDMYQIRNKWAKDEKLNGIQFNTEASANMDGRQQRLRDSLIGNIVGDIRVNFLSVSKPDKKLSKIQIDVRAQDELFAKRFNEELVKNVNDFYIQTKTKKSTENVTILQHKADSVRAVMNGAIYSAAAVADATPNLNPTRQVQRAAPVQRAQFSAETNKAILGEMVKNLEMGKMALMKETPLIEVVDGPIYPLPKNQLGKLKAILIGAFIAGMLTFLFLMMKLFIKEALSPRS